jgi:hypothetical protein
MGEGRQIQVPEWCENEKHFGIDLIIADILENLPVLSASNPPSVVPPWNSQDPEYVVSIFEFSSYYLQNDGVLLLIHNNDQKLTADIFDQAETYDFVMHKDWWGINDLELASPTDPDSKVFTP